MQHTALTTPASAVSSYHSHCICTVVVLITAWLLAVPGWPWLQDPHCPSAFAYSPCLLVTCSVFAALLGASSPGSCSPCCPSSLASAQHHNHCSVLSSSCCCSREAGKMLLKHIAGCSLHYDLALYLLRRHLTLQNMPKNTSVRKGLVDRYRHATRCNHPHHHLLSHLHHLRVEHNGTLLKENGRWYGGRMNTG